MSWLDEKLAERKATQEKRALIQAEAVNIYQALWDEIVQITDEAKQKGFDVSRNGCLQDRIVRRSVPPPLGRRTQRPLEFHLVLSQDKTLIETTGDCEVQFFLDLCHDGIVCLRDKLGKEVTPQRAAISILDPFLFPEPLS